MLLTTSLYNLLHEFLCVGRSLPWYFGKDPHKPVFGPLKSNECEKGEKLQSQRHVRNIILSEDRKTNKSEPIDNSVRV